MLKHYIKRDFLVDDLIFNYNKWIRIFLKDISDLIINIQLYVRNNWNQYVKQDKKCPLYSCGQQDVKLKNIG